MGFFAPWFLAGAVAVGLPVWLHLLKRHKTDPKLFPSLMFFEHREVSSMKHRRLEHLLLFALRAAMLILLALLFASPFIRRSNAAPDGKTWPDPKPLQPAANKGTHVEIELSGLIPNGVYSIWDVRLDEASNVIGLGSLGQNDGSQNHFQATASGHGEVSLVMAGGPLSAFGAADECQLDEAQFILFVVYHLDGQTHGPVPGPIPGCTFCEQFGFAFQP
jgi:hypothetical protein